MATTNRLPHERPRREPAALRVIGADVARARELFGVAVHYALQAERPIRELAAALRRVA